MMKVRLSIAARDDLERIAEWIASESPRSSARARDAATILFPDA